MLEARIIIMRHVVAAVSAGEVWHERQEQSTGELQAQQTTAAAAVATAEQAARDLASANDLRKDVNRGRCYNRICMYLIHSSGQVGDFCCHHCFRNYNESGGDLDIQEDWGEWHGPLCEKHMAPTSTPRTVTCTLPLKCQMWTCPSRSCRCPESARCGRAQK